MNCKKITSLLLAAVLLLALTACGGKEETAPAAPVGIAVQTETVLRDTISTEDTPWNGVSAKNTPFLTQTSLSR